jgi:hypothetical protein
LNNYNEILLKVSKYLENGSSRGLPQSPENIKGWFSPASCPFNSQKCKTKSAKCKLLHFALERVHLTDQLSNFRIISDYLKVDDFIEEMDKYCI